MAAVLGRGTGLALLLLFLGAAPAQADERTRVFSASMDRAWPVVRSTLLSLGWEVDKEDRAVGWIVTDSRRIEGEDYGVYAKGIRHRLRITMKEQPAGRTTVTVERTVFRRERILWVDKDEEIPTTDRTVERQVLDAFARAL
jgi:hypothetical protein